MVYTKQYKYIQPRDLRFKTEFTYKAIMVLLVINETTLDLYKDVILHKVVLNLLLIASRKLPLVYKF